MNLSNTELKYINKLYGDSLSKIMSLSVGIDIKEDDDHLNKYKKITEMRDSGISKKRKFKRSIPYKNICQHLNIRVKTPHKSSSNYAKKSWACFHAKENTIEMYYLDNVVYLHELSHAIDFKLFGLKIKKRDNYYLDTESSAEMSSMILAELLGIKIDEFSLHFIKRRIMYYAKPERSSRGTRKVNSFTLPYSMTKKQSEENEIIKWACNRTRKRTIQTVAYIMMLNKKLGNNHGMEH